MPSRPDQRDGIGNHMVHGIEHQRLPAPPEESDPAVRIQSPEYPANVIHVTRGLHDHVDGGRTTVKKLFDIVNLITPLSGKVASEGNRFDRVHPGGSENNLAQHGRRTNRWAQPQRQRPHLRP